MEKFLLGVLAGITGVTLTALIVDKLEGVNCGMYFNRPGELSPSREGKSENEVTETEPVDANEVEHGEKSE